MYEIKAKTLEHKDVKFITQIPTRLNKISWTRKNEKAATENTRKAPGPDGLQDYWVKNFMGCHEQLAEQLQQLLDGFQLPDWLIIGRTVLINSET